MVLIEILIIFILGLVFREDLKYRAVRWYYFLVLLILFIWEFIDNGYKFQFVLINISFLLFQLINISLFAYIRFRTFNIFKGTIGLGDILFWGILIFAFSPLNFLLFFISGAMFSLIVHLIFIKAKNKTIPFAGLQSLLLMLLFCAKILGLCWDLYDDYQLIDHLHVG